MDRMHCKAKRMGKGGGCTQGSGDVEAGEMRERHLRDEDAGDGGGRLEVCDIKATIRSSKQQCVVR